MRPTLRISFCRSFLLLLPPYSFDFVYCSLLSPATVRSSVLHHTISFIQSYHSLPRCNVSTTSQYHSNPFFTKISRTHSSSISILSTAFFSMSYLRDKLCDWLEKLSMIITKLKVELIFCLAF